MKVNIHAITINTASNKTGILLGATKGDSLKLHEAILSWFALPRSVIGDEMCGVLNTKHFATRFDNLPAHNNSGYGDRRYEYVLNLLSKDDIDYSIIGWTDSWGTGQINNGHIMYAYEVLGVHAHTKRVLEAMIDSEKPIVIFSRSIRERVLGNG